MNSTVIVQICCNNDKKEFSGAAGGAFDWGSKDYWFETHPSHCVVSLSKRLYPLHSTGSTKGDD